MAIHEIFEEGSLVSYWEKFGTIAFDQSRKAMLTSCILKNPDPASKVSVLHCCFSFTIRRDHNMWVFIVLFGVMSFFFCVGLLGFCWACSSRIIFGLFFLSLFGSFSSDHVSLW